MLVSNELKNVINVRFNEATRSAATDTTSDTVDEECQLQLNPRVSYHHIYLSPLEK